jgi:hypothetical protein
VVEGKRLSAIIQFGNGEVYQTGNGISGMEYEETGG